MELEVFHSAQMYQLPTIQIITNINSKHLPMTRKTCIMSTPMAAIKLNSQLQPVMHNRWDNNKAQGIMLAVEDKEFHMEVVAQ